jgi:microcystin degradation protein MlrC
MGIAPTEKHILLIKSTNHFYDSFVKIASQIIYCAAGKPYPNTPETTPYRKARKDIWPIMTDPFKELSK